MDSPGPGADLLRREYDGCLDALAEIRCEEARLAARKVRLVARCAGVAAAMAAPGMSLQEQAAQEMAFVAEVAGVLTVGEPAAAGLVAEARELTTALPLTFSALEAGTISWQHARIMVDEANGLGPEGAQALEAHFLDPKDLNRVRGCPAGEMVAGRFRARARTWRERHHPVSIEQRHAKSALDRRVLFSPDRDGMAWFSTYLPADTGSGIWERATAAARAMQGPDEPRTLTQLRADNVARWLLGGSHPIPGNGDGKNISDGAGTVPAAMPAVDSAGPGGPSSDIPSPRAQVLITVPVMALLGATEEPAMLDGYGPIPPSMARHLIADGADSFHRVLIDPRDGAPLEIGRTSYPVTKAQRQWLRLRDGKCPFPGCNNQSLDNEADHILAWAKGGTTGISNLGQPCRRHHRLRHTTAWKPTGATKDKPPGWISPAGRSYQSEQPDWEPPHWPDWQHAWNAGAPDESDGVGRDSQPNTVDARPAPDP
ncbi:HNH endonuclease signature motif containing protein [Pseudarthrobacter sulfonivorans]